MISEERTPEEVFEEPIVSLAKETVALEAKRIASIAKSEKLREIRRKLESQRLILRIPRRKLHRICSVALDTSFTDPPLELTGGKLITVIRSHIFYGCRPRKNPRADSKGFLRFVQEFEDLAKVYSKIIERKFVIELLKDVRNGREQLDLVMIDGEIFPRIPPALRFRKHSIMSKLYWKYLDLTGEMLELADETDVAIVGIVKRAYGLDIPIVADIPGLNINDKALATYILNPGEWIDLKSYSEVACYIEEFIKKHEDELPKSTLRRLKERDRWIVGVLEYVDRAPDVELAVYKSSTPTFFMLASKVELFISQRFLKDRIVSYLSSITGINGVPHPIDLVDSMCRITPNLLQIFQQQLYKELMVKLKDQKLAMSLAGLINPEKMYRIGFKG
ncbi:MAG: hypothetical protein DRO23_04815 [Thermoprotei archaeon]|nr:MAG: hypothetical protein DRO23_04815 [Thermoprotei archaeon]